MTMFASMCNPEYRGSNFSWEEFPDMIENYCKVQFPISSIYGNSKNIDKLSNECGKLGKSLAIHMCKESGFIKYGEH